MEGTHAVGARVNLILARDSTTNPASTRRAGHTRTQPLHPHDRGQGNDQREQQTRSLARTHRAGRSEPPSLPHTQPHPPPPTRRTKGGGGEERRGRPALEWRGRAKGSLRLVARVGPGRSRRRRGGGEAVQPRVGVAAGIVVHAIDNVSVAGEDLLSVERTIRQEHPVGDGELLPQHLEPPDLRRGATISQSLQPPLGELAVGRVRPAGGVQRSLSYMPRGGKHAMWTKCGQRQRHAHALARARAGRCSTHRRN